MHSALLYHMWFGTGISAGASEPLQLTMPLLQLARYPSWNHSSSRRHQQSIFSLQRCIVDAPIIPLIWQSTREGSSPIGYPYYSIIISGLCPCPTFKIKCAQAVWKELGYSAEHFWLYFGSPNGLLQFTCCTEHRSVGRLLPQRSSKLQSSRSFH